MSGIYSDLAGHLRGYEGHAQIATLSFLLEKCRCPPDAEVHVLRMLEQCCKDQKHTILYAKLSHEYSGNAALSELFDKKWSMDRDTENRKEQANLETQLTEKRNQALREEVAPNAHDFFCIPASRSSNFYSGAALFSAPHSVPSYQGRHRICAAHVWRVVLKVPGACCLYL